VAWSTPEPFVGPGGVGRQLAGHGKGRIVIVRGPGRSPHRNPGPVVAGVHKMEEEFTSPVTRWEKDHPGASVLRQVNNLSPRARGPLPSDPIIGRPCSC
jgi:hypothetical protein